jgi:hypothetical protein
MFVIWSAPFLFRIYYWKTLIYRRPGNHRSRRGSHRSGGRVLRSALSARVSRYQSEFGAPNPISNHCPPPIRLGIGFGEPGGRGPDVGARGFGAVGTQAGQHFGQ